uniref:Uncharacterized protein n=1 Tax=Caenorhabditis japonica TaxID=281687 RepID=A0A8R1HYF9_CAEJA
MYSAAAVCFAEFDKRFKWKSLKLLRGKRVEISEAIDSVKGYTYDPTVLQSLKKTGKCTGREIDKLSVFVTALAGWTESFASRDFQVFFLGLYHSLTFLGSLLATPGAILDLLDAMYKLHVFLEPDSLSIKWHTFYKHVHEHEQQFGPQHSTETYEWEHKTLMTSVNHQSTNCEYEILTRLPVLNNGACNIIERIALKPEHLSIINQLQLSAECTFQKREKYTSRMGSFVVSAQLYWKCDFTDQSCISCVDPIENNIRSVIAKYFLKTVTMLVLL